MSSIDNRIVQMEFDNGQFEAGVKQTMTSLDNLKKKLDLKGAGEGIKNIQTAVSKFDTSKMSNNVSETVSSIASHFTLLGRTIDRIENRIVDSIGRTIKSLSIDQVSSGWGKYEDTTKAVGTIMAATGDSIEKVQEQIDKLNWYTDETSYSLSDMITNIGQFTNVGVGLEDATTAMIGIANATGLAGKGVTEARRAMYNFSQAMGMGKLMLSDWKSIELAGLNTKQFQEVLLDAGVAMGTLVKSGEDYITTTTDGNGATAKITKNLNGFRDSLSSGWATQEVMIEAFKTMGEYSDKVYQIVQEKGVTAAEAMEMLAGAEESVSEKGFRASQEARSLTDALNAVKDAVSTGFMNTFQIIFGNYEQAKVMWTDLANTLYDVFAGPFEGLNGMLSEVFQDNNIIDQSAWKSIQDDFSKNGIIWEDITDALQSTAKAHGIAIDEMIEKDGSFIDSLNEGWLTYDILNETLDASDKTWDSLSKNVDENAKGLQDLESIAKRVIVGEFGNGETRVKKLTEAGYDYQKVQSAVNKLLKGEKIAYEELSDSELENLGYTDEQIEQINKLKKVSEETGKPLSELINTMNRPSGRQLMIESISNAFQGLMKVMGTVTDAFQEVFPPMTADRLYSIINRIHDFTKNLIISDETAEKLRNTFYGVFSIFKLFGDAITTVGGFLMRVLWPPIKLIAGGILNVGSAFGIAIHEIQNGLKPTNAISAVLSGLGKVFSTLGSKISTVWKTIKGSFDASGVLDPFKSKWEEFKTWIDSNGGVIGIINTFFDRINNWIKGIDSSKIVSHISKFINKIKDSFKNVKDLRSFIEKSFNSIINFFKNIGNKISKSLEKPRKSLSTSIGNIIESIKSFFKGDNFENIKDFVSQWSKKFIDFIKKSFSKIGISIENVSEIISNSFSKVLKWLGTGISNIVDFLGETLPVVVNLLKTITLLRFLGGVNKFVRSISKAIKSFSKIKSAKALDTKGNAFLKMAASIGILVGAIYVLTKLDPNLVYNSITMIGALVGVMVAGFYALDKVMTSADGSGIKKISGFLSLALSLLVLVRVIKKINRLSDDDLLKGLIRIAAVFAELIAFTKLADTDYKSSSGVALLLLALSLQQFVLAILELGSMNPEKATRGLMGLAVLLTEMAIFTRLMSKNYLSILNGNKVKQLQGMVGLIGTAIALQGFILALNKIANMNPEKAVVGLIGLGVLLAEVGVFSRLMSRNMKASTGLAMIGIAESMIIFASALKMIGSMDFKTLAKGLAGMGVAMLEISVLMKSMSGSINVGSGIGFTMMMLLLLTIIPLFKELSKISNIFDVGVGFGAAVAGIGVGIKALSSISPGAAATAGANVAIFTAVIAGIVGIASLLGSIPGSIDFMDNGVALLTNIGEAIGGFVGGIAGKALEGLSSAIPQIGQDLSDFWTNVTPFVEGIKSIKAEDLAGAGALSDVVLKLTASEFLDALTKLVGGGENNLASFGRQIAGLGPQLSTFSDYAKNVDPAAVQNAADALSAISGIEYRTGGFVQLIIGEQNFGLFGEQLATLGPNLAKFANSVNGVSGGFGNVSSAANALKDLVSVDIPTVGGIVNAIVGRTDWATFGNQLAVFGPGLVRFANSVNGVEGGFDNISSAAKALGELLSIDAPSTNFNLVDFFTGETDWGIFGDQLKGFGEGFAKFAGSMQGVTAEQLAGVDPAVSALDKLLQLDPPKEGGFWQSIVGESGWGSFGDNIGSIGTGFGTLNTNVKDIDTAHMTSVVSILERLGAFANSISPSIEENIRNFSYAMDFIDKDYLNFDNAFEAIKGFDSEFEDNGKTLGEAVANGIGNGIKETDGIITEIKNVLIDSVQAIIGFLHSFNTAGVALIQALITGMKSQGTNVSNTAKMIGNNGYTSFKNMQDTFKKAGGYLIDGLIQGMKDKRTDLENAAKMLAHAANQAFNDSLEIESPSKVTYASGGYFVDGFVNGLQNGSKNIEKSASNLGYQAISSFQSTMGLVQGIINNSIDLQPMIRPVVDLESVRSGASQISSIFSQDQTIGLGGYQNPFIPNVLSQIKSNMSFGSAQPGYVDNTDVIAAINELGDEISTLKESIAEMGLFIDGDNLVGRIINKIDKRLGKIAEFKSRGG